MKKILALIIAFAMVFALAACGAQNNASNENANKPEEVKALTYSEYLAAGDEAAVVIEGYVQVFAYSKAYGNVSMFIQDDDGAYYAFRAVCSEDQAAALAEGVHVKVSGNKTSWSGEQEVAEGCTFEILEGTKVYPAADVTADLGDADKLIQQMNRRISAGGLVVEPSTDADGNPAAFLYNWDGSGAAGSNNDIYFNASCNGSVYTFTVESDEWAEGSAPYAAATSLNIGDVIDIEGQMYWYNGPNIHVSSISVTKASKADSAKGAGVLSFADYMAADYDTEAVIEGYVQAYSYSRENQNVNMFLADADGYYYAYKASCDDATAAKLSAGTKVKVSGYKSEWRGLVEMQEGCTFEIEDGYYIAPAVDATDKLGDEEALKALMAGRVIFKGLTIAPSTIDGEEGEYAFLYNWNGSGMEGSNSDLYFNASLNGQVYTFTVESDEVPEGSDTYTAVTRLNIGDTVDIEGFLYWYNTAETHVHEITVK